MTLLLQKTVLTVMEMSLQATIVISVVLALRFLFRKLPKSYACVLWLMVLFRLLCPVALSSEFSLMPESAVFITEESFSMEVPVNDNDEQNGRAVSNADRLNAMQQSNDNTNVNRDAAVMAAGGGKNAESSLNDIVQHAATILKNFLQEYSAALGIIWCCGALILTGMYIISWFRWKSGMGNLSIKKAKKISDSTLFAPFGTYLLEKKRIQEPFVRGIFRPVIYLPAGMEAKSREYILCHEQMHIRHGDPLKKILWQFALTIHWFNPLVWLAAKLMQKDMEMFCDESVMRCYGKGARKEYALTLLEYSVQKSGLPFPVAFGESNTGSRVYHILKVKKPAAVVSAFAIAVIGIAAAVFLTDPENEGGIISTSEERQTESEAVAAPEMQMSQESSAESGQPARTETESTAEAGANVSAASNLPNEDSRAREMYLTANKWAMAFTDRNGEAMAALVSDASIMDEYRMGDGSYDVGWSSPWPWSYDYDLICDYAAGEAIIYYYANTSDPHIWLWKQTLTLEERAESYLINDVSYEMDTIYSVSDFRQRYAYGPEGENSAYHFKDTPLDPFYEEHLESSIAASWGAWLIRNKEMLLKNWRTPEIAAKMHLNLGSGAPVEVESPWEDKVCLRWEFEDGMTDVICLSNPVSGENGEEDPDMWVVENILNTNAYAAALSVNREIARFEKSPELLSKEALKGELGLTAARESKGGLVELIALPDRSAVLYGLITEYSEGVLLEENGRCSYFDQHFVSLQMRMPEMAKHDYDRDGQDELMITYFLRTGTQTGVQQLYVLEKQPEGTWEQKEFEPADYLTQIEQNIAWSYQTEPEKLRFFNQTEKRQLSAESLEGVLDENAEYEGVEFGNLIYFSLEEDGIWLEAEPKIVTKDSPVGSYGQYRLRAKVNYDGSSFVLSDYQMLDNDTKELAATEEITLKEMPVTLKEEILSKAYVSTSRSVYEIRLVMTKGEYFTEEYAGPGGGIYAENYRGTYELRAYSDMGLVSSLKLTDESGNDIFNFGEKFDLAVTHYNGDGLPDFSLGQWGSSNLGIYDMYTVTDVGEICRTARGITDAGLAFSAEFERTGDGFITKVYHNDTGKYSQEIWNWDEEGKEFVKK